MADPTDPTTTPTAAINDQTAATVNLTTATNAQTQSSQELHTVNEIVKTSINNIEAACSAAGVSLDNLTALTQDQINKFSDFAVTAVNARVAFNNFSNVDYKGISTITDQVKILKEALATTPATLFAKALEDAGVSHAKVAKALVDGKPALLALATNLATNTDNAIRFQTAAVQMAARTGELGDMFTKTGDHLQNMNEYMSNQNTMLEITGKATNLTKDQTEQWYNQLGLIPGALKQTVDGTSMLTATIQAATGAGMSQAETMENLSTAFKDYNLQGEKALLFSVRMSDVSTKLHAPIEDVEKALRGSADAFRMFVTGQEDAASSAESLSKTLNEYGAALESTGLSATQTAELTGNLVKETAKLNYGQLSFISKQTGGASGLQGAAQETLKLQKDPGAVVDDAMKALQQQFGKIVTVQEAATSQAAASQNYKQTQMLQSLLGKFAPDQASANRLLEAMKNKAEGNPKAIADALSNHPLQDAASKGVDIQAKSYSVTTKIMNTVEQIRDIVGRSVSDKADKLTGAYTSQTNTIAEEKFKESLRKSAADARTAGGDQIKTTNAALVGGNLIQDTKNINAANSMHEIIGSLKDVPIALQATANTIMEDFHSGNTEDLNNQRNILKEAVEAKKMSVTQLAGSQGEAVAKSELKSLQSMLNATEAGAASSTASSGKRVGTAAHHAAAYKAPGTDQASGTAAHTGLAPYKAPGAGAANANALHIIGKITIDCPHCGKPHDASSQFKAYTGPAGQSQQ